MAERYTSLMALVVDRPVADVGAVVAAARRAGAIDRHAAVGAPREAQEVHWGGRMGKAVVRAVEAADAAHLLRVEAYIGGEGPVQGLRRQSALLAALRPHVDGQVTGVRDLSSSADHDLAWLDRVSRGDVRTGDVVVVHAEGRGTHWVHSHGAARLDVPDLELYGVNRSRIPAAERVIRHVHDQLLRGGLTASLSLPDDTAVYLVPVLEAWSKLPLDWPGIGRAGQDRPGHDGPRATLSVLHRPRFGRYRKDLGGVVERLEGIDAS